MKQKQFMAVMLVCLLMLLLTGCGQSMTLEEKVAEVQGKNEITTQDVVQLMKLEGLSVEKQKVSAEFAELCPDTEVYKVNGDNLLLMKATEATLNDRREVFEELGWYNIAKYYDTTEETLSLLKQLEKDYQPEDGTYQFGITGSVKNIVVYQVPVVNETKAVEEQIKEYTVITETIRKVLQEDIKGMQTYHPATVGKDIQVLATIHTYQMPYTTGKITQYDYYLSTDFELRLSDEVMEKYKGQEFRAEVKGPLEHLHYLSNGSTGCTGNLDEVNDNTISMELGNNSEVSYEVYTGPIQYEVTFSVGDISETLIVGVDEAVTAETTAPVEK